MCGCVRWADDLFVCFGVKPKQRAWDRDIPRDRKWTRKEGPRKDKRAIDEGTQREQSTTESRRDQLAWDSNLGEGRSGMREDSQIWMSIPSGVCRSFAKIYAQMHEKLHKIVTENSLSCDWSWPKVILFICSSFHPQLYFFVAVKKCEIPRRKPLDESLAMNNIGLKKLISRGSATRGVSQMHLG